MLLSQIKPILNNVLILPHAAPAEKSGIFIPDAFRDNSSRGTVIAVGPGKSEREMLLQPGDEIIYPKLHGQEVEIEGTKYLFLNDDLIIARV